jgi:uncharacterized protein YjaG (DUF416 family)|tara:strand:+ start:50 stop:646 length:597 start_codon:yes stop_codon:yes gene_type:complete
VAIHIPLKDLSQWQQVAFCSALLERMLPNYKMFSDVEQFGEFKVIRNQLDLVWQWLDKNNRCKINFTAQLTKLEEQTPNPEHFNTFGVFPALDVCMALMSLLQAMQDKDDEGFFNVSRLSANSVNFYVELLLSEALNNQDEEVIIEDDINQHPLTQWEVESQQELFDFIKSGPENKTTCIKAKTLMLEEGLSNLGIEI